VGNADIAVLSNINFDGFLEGAHVVLDVGCAGNSWAKIGRCLELPKSTEPKGEMGVFLGVGGFGRRRELPRLETWKNRRLGWGIAMEIGALQFLAFNPYQT
jgi:hypothetical protein